MSALVSRWGSMALWVRPFGSIPRRCNRQLETDNGQITDETLLGRIALGEREAFAAFYDRHAPVLYGLALRIVRDPQEAEDVLQDALIQLWEKASVFDRSLGKPLSWAMTLVRHRSIDRWRALQRQSRVFEYGGVDSDERMEGPSLAASGSEAAVLAEEAEGVRQSLALLPVDQRQAIELAFFGGLSQTEIAVRLGQPLGTIKARVRRGMIRLREALQPGSLARSESDRVDHPKV